MHGAGYLVFELEHRAGRSKVLECAGRGLGCLRGGGFGAGEEGMILRQVCWRTLSGVSGEGKTSYTED